MHELSIVQSMITLIKQQNPPKPLKLLNIRVGMLSCVSPGALQSCFEAIKCSETLLEHCELSILETNPTAQCPDCHRQFVLNQLGQPCQCGGFDYQVSGGDDLTLASIEY